MSNLSNLSAKPRFFKRITTLLLIALPICLQAGDPVPGIGITVDQGTSGIKQSGQTNDAGELVLSGFKPGACVVTIVLHNGKVTVIGAQEGDRVTLPADSNQAIKPIRVNLGTQERAAFFSKKGYDYYTARSDVQRASGRIQTKRPGGTLNKAASAEETGTVDGATARANHNTTRSNKTAPASPTVDEDCDGVVEIHPMPRGQIKISVTCG